MSRCFQLVSATPDGDLVVATIVPALGEAVEKVESPGREWKLMPTGFFLSTGELDAEIDVAVTFKEPAGKTETLRVFSPPMTHLQFMREVCLLRQIKPKARLSGDGSAIELEVPAELAVGEQAKGQTSLFVFDRATGALKDMKPILGGGA